MAWTNLLMAPDGITISVTDSNPLVSILVKPFSNFLPVEIQYVGYWYLLSIVLTYVLSFAIIRGLCGYRWDEVQPTQRIGIVAGAALVTLAPYLFFRLVHDTLTAQWIVLAAIWIFLFTEAGIRQPGMYAALIALSMFVHPYFVPMSLAFAGASMMQNLYAARGGFTHGLVLRALFVPSVFYLGAIGLSVLLLGLWRIRGVGAEGVGVYSMDPFAWFNSMGNSQILPGWTVGSGQYEGFQYLGLGVIAALVFSIVILATKKAVMPERLRISLPWLAIILSILFLAAVSPIVTVFGITVIDTGIQNVPLIGKILEAFRSSGRLFWPASYLTAIFSVVVLLSARKRWSTWLVVGCLAVQVIDIKPMADDVQRQTSPEFVQPVLKFPDVWKELLRDTSEIVFAPLDFPYSDKRRFYELMTLALPFGVSSNLMYTAQGITARTSAGSERDLHALLAEASKGGRLLVIEESAAIDIICSPQASIEAQGFHLLDGVVVKPPAPPGNAPGLATWRCPAENG